MPTVHILLETVDGVRGTGVYKGSYAVKDAKAWVEKVYPGGTWCKTKGLERSYDYTHPKLNIGRLINYTKQPAL